MRRCAPLAIAGLVTTLAGPALADARVYQGPEDQEWGLRSLDLYGWAQPRFAWQQSDVRRRPDGTYIVDFEPNPVFSVRRARMGTIAWLSPWVRAQFEIEAAREYAQTLDAYLYASPIPEVAVTVGQFRVPFNRQNLLPSKNYQLPDTAYWVSSKFIVDRDIGAQLSGDFLGGRFHYAFGVFNGNEPALGQTQNQDPYFLWAGRIDIAPLGPVPRFEGDLRPLAERHDPKVQLGFALMRNRSDDTHLNRMYVATDLAGYWEGASLFAELYARRDAATDGPACPLGTGGWIFHDDSRTDWTCTTAIGWNVQAGYFPPVPWVREHLEAAVRVERFDPAREVKQPANDAGARDLDQSNPTWGYLGYVFGLNLFANRSHDVKLQTSYEIRNETKRCLDGQSGSGCTGYIENNLFLVQATGAF